MEKKLFLFVLCFHSFLILCMRYNFLKGTILWRLACKLVPVVWITKWIICLISNKRMKNTHQSPMSCLTVCSCSTVHNFLCQNQLFSASLKMKYEVKPKSDFISLYVLQTNITDVRYIRKSFNNGGLRITSGVGRCKNVVFARGWHKLWSKWVPVYVFSWTYFFFTWRWANLHHHE
jgi:hypothetical protein